MKLNIFKVDAFTNKIFTGNPAAVCPLESWLPDKILQAVAMENNLSETAFYVPVAPNTYDLRWFTPAVEVDLCGHATLATAFILSTEFGVKGTMHFNTRSGPLTVTGEKGGFTMDFPCQPPARCEVPQTLIEGLNLPAGTDPETVLAAEDYLVVLKTEDQVRNLQPDLTRFAGLNLRGVIVTAPGETCDFVSRWFGIGVGVDEDPVTGSAHTTLTPYWAERLGKSRLSARQVSARSGELDCELGQGSRTGRVLIRGRAVKYLEGIIFLGQ